MTQVVFWTDEDKAGVLTLLRSSGPLRVREVAATLGLESLVVLAIAAAEPSIEIST